MMKILYVCNEIPPSPHGGIGSFVHTLAHTLAGRGHEIVIAGFDAAAGKTAWEEQGPVRVKRIASPYRNMKGIEFLRWRLNPAFILERMYLSKIINEIVAERGIQLVESFDWSGPLWRRPPVPLLTRLHGANTAHRVYENLRPSLLLKFAEKRNVEMADELVAVSDHIGRLTLKALGLGHKKFATIHNGVDTSAFQPSSEDGRDKNLVFYAGTIHPRKGLAELFQAMARVFAYDPSAQFFLAGRLPEDDGRIQKELLSMVPEKFHPRVRFLGHVLHQDMPRLYQRATLAVFPSRAEAFGLTCVEAMACGVPVVMTARASGPEIVEDGVSGLLVNPDAPQEMAGLILSLLGDSRLRSRLAQGGRARAVEKFDLASQAVKNEELYETAIKNSAAKFISQRDAA